MSSAEPEKMPPQSEPEQDSSIPETDGGANPLEEKISALEAELSTAKDKMMRALADADNSRKRAVKEREDATRYAVTSFARDLLDFVDNFGRALAAIPPELKTDDRIKNTVTGIEAMQQSILSVLQKHGIRRLEPMDEPFNPNFHEVMFEIPGTGKPAGTIIQLVDAGYILHDRLLRPARVGVAKGDAGDTPSRQVDATA